MSSGGLESWPGPALLWQWSVCAQDLAQVVGTSSVVVQSGLLMALLLLMIRRFGARLPFGWLTFVFTLNGAARSAPHSDPWVIPLTLVAGLVADVLYRLLQPEIQRPTRLRLFTALMSIGLYSLYFLIFALLGGVWWSAPLWTGAILLSGIVGWLVSYLVAPFALPEEAGH